MGLPTTIYELVDHMLGHEGGYVNDPKDPGGETNWGVTIGNARAAGYRGDMKDMPRDWAVRFYIDKFWKAPKFDQVGELCWPAAVLLFDQGVNMGVNTAAKALQRVLNALNREAKDYPDLAVDGALGPKSIAALRSYLSKRPGIEGRRVLCVFLLSSRGERYLDIVEGRPTSERFLYGWGSRLASYAIDALS